ncbi:hypothetical protein RhiirB3_437098 [Rhizophagus irregularis]|nr:hypothetical protein RhiirB3_437098 [Rhizophagus irregularis]
MPLSDLRNLLDSPNNFNRRYYRRNPNRRNRRRIQRQRHTLRLIAQLPLQITNNPFENQLFNGTPFY